MAQPTHRFQAPKGTRDFYPQDMAVRRYIESVWRQVSINHGFEEIDGPTFEHLDLYTQKSGEEIVSQLFSFRREGGDTDYALRPEFTPTLARMYAANANSLSKPTKWFCMPNFFRAERPQRGRLREFYQWNVDVIGDDSPRADAEVIACCIGVLERLGLTPKEVRVKVSSRPGLETSLTHAGARPEDIGHLFALMDRLDNITDTAFNEYCDKHNVSAKSREAMWKITNTDLGSDDGPELLGSIHEHTNELWRHLDSWGRADWLVLNPSIVRGLAYYTGTVFEVHEISGKERAVAGGGRYDKLIEMFGGPPTPAVGIAMGDVVIRLLLEDRGLLQPAEHYLPRPDAFIISNGSEAAEQALPGVIAALRSNGLHVRQSYRSTRNVGKLLGEADKCRSRFAVILGDELVGGRVTLKNLGSGEQTMIAIDALPAALLGSG